MKPKLDVLDFWSIIKPELPGVNGLCTQVTAFMDEATLRQRLTDLCAAGMEGVVVRRRTAHHERRRGLRRRTDRRPVDLSRPGAQPRRDPDPHPRRRTGPVQLQVQPGRDLRHDPAAVFRRDRRLPDRVRQEHRSSARNPAVVRLRAEGREPRRPDQLADPGPGQRRGGRRAGVRQTVGRQRTRAEAPADGRPVQAGDRRRRRPRLPAEHPFRGDLRGVRPGVRDLRGDARLLVARPGQPRWASCGGPGRLVARRGEPRRSGRG